MNSQDVPESDWRRFRELRELALERFCIRALDEVEHSMRDAARTYHERYAEIFRTLKDRDRELSHAFDDPRRSRMIQQLAAMRAQGLVESAELAAFTGDTRTAVERAVSLAQ